MTGRSWTQVSPDRDWAEAACFTGKHGAREDECNGQWLLKKSIFLKTAEIWGIENVYEKRERRL
jgi:hypothetical protein